MIQQIKRYISVFHTLSQVGVLCIDTCQCPILGHIAKCLTSTHVSLHIFLLKNLGVSEPLLIKFEVFPGTTITHVLFHIAVLRASGLITPGVYKLSEISLGLI